MSYTIDRTADGDVGQFCPGDHISLTYEKDGCSYCVLKAYSLPQNHEHLHLEGPVLTIWVRSSQYKRISTDSSMTLTKGAFAFLMKEDEEKVCKILTSIYENAVKQEKETHDLMTRMIIAASV